MSNRRQGSEMARPFLLLQDLCEVDWPFIRDASYILTIFDHWGSFPNFCSIPNLGSLVRFEDLFSDAHGEWGHLNQFIFFDKLDGLLKA